MSNTAIVSGFWAQNLGNGFFNIGGKALLDKVIGEGKTQFIHDRPSYRTFYNQSKGDQKNYVRIHEMLDIEYLVLQGPMLTKNFSKIWGEAFKELHKRNVKVLLVGASFFKFTEEEVTSVKKFLAEYPPHLISTRDHEAYEILKDLKLPVHNGIDSAFFVPDAFSPLQFTEKFVTFAFDRYPEPTLQENVTHKKNSISFKEKEYYYKQPKVQSFFSGRGKAESYFGHLIDFRKLPRTFDGLQIIRPEHRYAPHMTQKIYQHPNSIVSDEVFTYFSLYANTELTLSDRVHACVLSLAYGNPAMLFTPSPRKALFGRLGLDNISEGPVTLDPQRLQEEKEGVINFLKNSL